MLKVAVNGQEYTIEWRYEEAYLSPRMTFCHIFQIDKEDCKYHVSSGDAICLEGDQFSKEVGRKISLTRALKSLFPYDRESRKVFWQAYFGRKK